MLCIAHRGARGDCPPGNTLESIELAIRQGAPWIEIDVQLVEGELLILHDRPKRGMTLAELRALDLGNGQRIPTLAEVLGAIHGRVGLNIELKDRRTAEPVVRELASRIGVDWRYDQFLISSFKHNELRRVKELEPSLPLGFLATGTAARSVQKAVNLGCYSLHLERHQVRKKLIDKAHRLGLKVFVYTVNEASDIERMKTFGVDGVFTDYPKD